MLDVNPVIYRIAVCGCFIMIVIISCFRNLQSILFNFALSLNAFFLYLYIYIISNITNLN